MSEGIQLEKEPRVQVPILSKEEHVWLQAWINVARADNCTRAEIATRWANDCVKDFKAKFGSIKQ